MSNLEEHIMLKDPRAEKIMIEELIRKCNQIGTMMRIGAISDVGIAEVYDVLSSFRSLVHLEHEEKLNCGCKELRERWRKEEEHERTAHKEKTKSD
jgi:hypothetical protein